MASGNISDELQNSSLGYYYRGIKNAAKSLVRGEIAQDKATIRNIKERGFLKGTSMVPSKRPFATFEYPVPDHPRTTGAQMKARLAARQRTKTAPRRRIKSR